jgi:hypothetical protein
MRKVDVYIEVIADSNNYEKLELFNDEEIQINSSIQNVQDLAKVYTDFTQSFTIPASPHNNRLFEHFYQSDVDANDNPNIRRNAFIEISTIPFRSGKISIESSNVVKGRVESYSITFYGDLTSLKDKFGDDTLKDLDLSVYSEQYNGNAVRTSITTNNALSHIRYPLISSNRLWSYGDGSNTDISNSSYPIVYTELFPALRVKKIFEAIETKYNVSFNSNFFNQKLFTELFLWLKNAKTMQVLTETVQLTVDDLQVNDGSRVNTTTDTVDLSNTEGVFVYAQGLANVPTAKLYLDVYVNNSLINTFELKGTGTYRDNQIIPRTTYNGTNLMSFKIRASVPCTATVVGIRIEFKSIGQSVFAPIQAAQFRCLNKTFSFATVDPTVYAPNIKVSDFVSGIFKMFNLTCYATSVDNFQVEPLDDWYTKGAVVDVTEYVDTDEITIERHKLYKEISFDYEKSESFLNKEYFDSQTNAPKEFGSYKETNSNYDGGEYKIDIPFENIRFSKVLTTNVNEPPTAFCLNEKTSDEAYDNKPILLYYNENSVATSFYFNTGISTAIVSTYKPLTNQTTYNNATFSNHFAVEGSPFDATYITNTLYSQYYDSYLKNLYNQKNRLTNVKALFPISLLTSLKLNDRLIIRDKRYVINEMKVNLTTGDVDLALINDFRAVSNINIPVQSALGGIIEVPIIVPNGATETSITFDDPTYTGVTFISTENELLSFIVSANTTGLPISKNFLRDGQLYTTIYQDA